MRKDSSPSHFVLPPLLVFSFFSARCAIGSAEERVADSVVGSVCGSAVESAVDRGAGETAIAVLQVNINTASPKQLAVLLSGVGERRAEAIITYREPHGPFRKRADLAPVKGISTAMVKKNKDRIFLK